MLSKKQIEFLACEMSIAIEDVQSLITNDPDELMSMCAGIVTEETNWEEANNNRFNYNRREVAEDIMEELM